MFPRGITNFIRNPRAEGSSAGTPGTPPTNWTVQNPTGITGSIVGTGTENGVPYLDYGFSGTSVAGGVLALSFEGTTVIPAVLGQQWTSSFYAKLQAGSLTGFTNLLNAIVESDSGGTALATHIQAITPPGTTLDLDRVSLSFVNNQATVAFVRSQLRCTIPATTAITCTLRIGAPQLELGGVANLLAMPPVGAPGYSTRWV